MRQANPTLTPIEKPASGPHAAALLSHDILSALTRIMSASTLLSEAGLPNTEAGHVAHIKEAALYINDLLGVAGDEREQVMVTELAPALARLENIWKVEAAQKGVVLELVQRGILPGALRIPVLDFLRVFNNILGNALKFSEQGRIVLRLLRDPAGALRFEVLDDGPGFDMISNNPDFALRAPPAGSGQSGSGFGLHIAHGLLEKAGAEIQIKNRPDGGACVAVVFPEDLLIAAAKPEAAARPKPGLPDLSHLKILLAEDNPTNQMVATQMLKKMNARVETASDGVEALQKWEVGDYNLGLIDIEMPRKSGLEVMREVRARDDVKASATLLALTAYVLPEHRARITAAGADGIIAKPLTDVAAFGNAILVHTGEAAAGGCSDLATGTDEIQMDIYDGLKEIIGHGSMQELLGKVQSDLEDVRAGVLAGVAAKDAAPIRAQTHILISVAGAIGAVDLQHIAEQLNATAKRGDWPRIIEESGRCESGITSVLAFVANELDS